MKKIFRKEVIIGLIVLIALAILVVGIDYLKGVNIFKASNYYYLSYSNVEGLGVSAPVTVNGFKIGQVREIALDYSRPGKVCVEISLDKNFKVPSTATASLATDLLGTASIKLDIPDHNGPFYTIGDTIQSKIVPGLMSGVTDNLIPKVESIIPQIDTLLTNINRLVSDPAIIISVKRLDVITANLQASAARLNATMGALQPAVNNINEITANVNTVSQDMTQISANLKELPIDSIVGQLNLTMHNLKELSDHLNNPNSTLGKLSNDSKLYDNMNSVISNLDSLIIDVKRNPRRYINVKLF